MAIKVKAVERELKIGNLAGQYRYILQADLYNKLSDQKVIQEASLRSGITKGSISAAWEAIGEVIKAWATEGHSVAVPGLGSMRFGIRSTSVANVNDVATDLITSRRVIFTPNVDIKDELKRTSINITCYDRNGELVKRVTSADDGDVEDNENDPSAGSGTGENSNENSNPNQGGNQGGDQGEDQGGNQGGDQSQKKSVNLTVSPAGAGTVTGGGQYDSGASVNIGATPASGYHFVKWNDNSTSANRTLNVLDSDIDLMAIFEADVPDDDDEENPGGGNEGGDGPANY